MEFPSGANSDQGQTAREDGEVRAGGSEDASPLRWQVSDLLKGGRVAIIEHAGKEYRLRLTANDKLILTK